MHAYANERGTARSVTQQFVTCEPPFDAWMMTGQLYLLAASMAALAVDELYV